MRLAKSKVHFIGIGGIGMSGLAELLHNMGAKVSGSDLADNANVQRLKQLGVKTFIGHERANVIDADVVVYSSAVNFENPEIVEAKSRRIPIIPRAEVLAEIMRIKRGIAVGGTHGKTTTTSMIATIMIQGNFDPTVVVGGRLDLIKSNSFLGQGDWLVAEADESDGSFLKLSPEISIVTNIDNDHMEFFKSDENLDRAFLDFAARIPFYGVAIACGDDQRIRRVFKDFNKNIYFYGFNEGNDFRLAGEKGRYKVYKDKREIGSFALSLPGRHNALNAVASIIAGLEVGIPFETCAEALNSFLGVDRRFQLKGEAKGVRVYDDYGHHPTEVRAVLSAFREKFPERRLVALFQPHRYTRTQTCWTEFCESFNLADQVYVMDIYSAGEKPVANVTAERLAAEMKGTKATYVGDGARAVQTAVQNLKEGDIFVTLGAGDVWKSGMKVLELLGSRA
ncbi:MAG TPA: UDP-N-acetylmuramate--L-alanine ligase [Bdellovibrionales bacterium]|nr:UDP-N-acetylmuramate--L-alanine ligase [Bdellovibrionales bacterium]